MPTNKDEPAQPSTSSREQDDAEVRKLAEKLRSESRKSAILGFIGGMIVVAGLAATFYSASRSRSSLQEQIQTTDTLKGEVRKKSAEASLANQKAESAKSVLSATVQDLQTKGPAVSASAISAVDQAFETNPNAARLIVRVYIHMHSPAQIARARTVATELSNAGFFVPGIDAQPQDYKETQVHYYNNDSQSVSDAAAIAKVVAGTGIPVEQLQTPPYKGRMRPRAYGVWLAADLK